MPELPIGEIAENVADSSSSDLELFNGVSHHQKPLRFDN